MTFEPPDRKLFPCLDFAYAALKAGGVMPAVMNAANEAAVDLFLKEKISFLNIPALIEDAMSAYNIKHSDISVDDVIAAGDWASDYVYQRLM